MKRHATTLNLLAGLIAMLLLSPGCASTEGSDTQVSGSMYYGVGFHDPWYYGGAYPPDVIVTPPPDRPVEPPHVEHYNATPPATASTTPRPMPSIPSMPRPAFRR
jgi:hypothetical protein